MCLFTIVSMVLGKMKSDVRDIATSLVSDISRTLAGESDIIMQDHITRNHIISKVLSTALGVGASAIITYYGIKWLSDAMDPTKKEKKQAQMEAKRMLQKLGVENKEVLSEYELCVAANLLDPKSITITWDDIGGLDSIVHEIQDTVILPFQRSDLFRNSSLLQPPKGILLHGPPGCGKTMIAKATAKAAGARFINLQVSTLVDKWYGESQKRAEAVFSLAKKLQPTIVFIDEIDSFLRSRSATDHEATAMMKTQFMSLWDGITSDPNCLVMIMGATNRRRDVDAAILRRMPCQFFIDLPNQEQRQSILQLILSEENTDNLNYDQLSQLAAGLSGSDLREACRVAAMTCLNDYVLNNPTRVDNECGDNLRNISMSDLQHGIHKVQVTKQSQPILLD